MNQERKQIKIFQNQDYKKLGILYGLFFEDLNHAADGGLYAEMVQNRSFEYCEMDRKEYHALTAWEKTGAIEWEVRTGHPLHTEKPHYLHVKSQPGGAVRNTGYNTGFFVENGKDYDFSMYAGGVGGSINMRVTVEEEEAVCAEGKLAVSGREWKKYELQMKASRTTTCGRLVLTFETGGMCDLDMISFFPQDTFLGKKGGLRKDIAEALQEMHPKFMAFRADAWCTTAA